MCTAKDIMRGEMVTIDPDASVEQAIDLMLDRGLTGLPVVDGGSRLLGFLSEFDLLDLILEPRAGRSRVYEHMTRSPVVVGSDDDVSRVTSLFRSSSVCQLPVVHEGVLVGLVHRGDVLGYVLQMRRTSPLSAAASGVPC
ncbi:MAG: HPP family protein [Planctomycetota bacterium]